MLRTLTRKIICLSVQELSRVVDYPAAREYAAVGTQKITREHFTTLGWEDYLPGWFRIVADVTCGRCGAYQAADSDPVQDKEESINLCVRLFNHVGWRVSETGEVLCPECSGEGA